MLFISAAIALGIIAYVVVVVRQPRAQKIDLEKWQDLLGIAAVASLVLVGFVMWSALGSGPGASFRSILEAPFAYRLSRWLIYFAGFAATSFTVLAALHVVFLRLRGAGRNGREP